MAADFSHWSDYWESGALTSLPEDFAANYDGEIATFWQEQFRVLPPKPRLLDVCTGNGAVALLAAQARPDAMISALDAAVVSPQRAVSAHPALANLVTRIEFLPGVPLEEAELPSASYNLICSQYGLEYSDWSQSAAVVNRLLAPGGRLAIVAHSPDSSMIETMRMEADVHAAIFANDAIQAFRKFSDSTSFSPAWFRSQLRALKGELSVLAKQWPAHPFLEQLEQVCNHLQGLGERALNNERPSAGVYYRQLATARARLEDMLAVNQRIKAAGDWFRVFEQAGLEVIDQQTLYHQARYRCGEARVFQKP